MTSIDGGERIEHEAEPQRLFAKSEPGEILQDTIAGRLQGGPKSDERENAERSPVRRSRVQRQPLRREFDRLRIKSEAASGTAGISQR